MRRLSTPPNFLIAANLVRYHTCMWHSRNSALDQSVDPDKSTQMSTRSNVFAFLATPCPNRCQAVAAKRWVSLCSTQPTCCKLLSDGLTEKLSRSAGWAGPPLWISIPINPKSRDTTSAEGAVGSSGCWAAKYSPDESLATNNQFICCIIN
jgi:hypothetical protein